MKSDRFAHSKNAAINFDEIKSLPLPHGCVVSLSLILSGHNKCPGISAITQKKTKMKSLFVSLSARCTLQAPFGPTEEKRGRKTLSFAARSLCVDAHAGGGGNTPVPHGDGVGQKLGDIRVQSHASED